MAKRESIIPKAAMERILEKAGAPRVGKDAMASLAEVLEKEGMRLSELACQNARHAGRKTIHDSDVKLAVETKE